MKKTDLTFRDLIENNQKLTFLVGAGCSIDPPSCLPAGHAMMQAIIKYTCVESEQEEILELAKSGTLRFEALVEIIRDLLDSELKIIDYYGLSDKPNIQHFFFAEMIKKGHFVMTTNFDFLIEYALHQSGVPDAEILPVITRDDFEKYDNPENLFNDNKKTVYKIHGSTKNIITRENTRKSLMVTIQAFGLNKKGLNIFQVEPFKKSLFDNISSGRSLIVMGYSGSDDFDVVPTLKILKNIQNIIWINFVKYDGNKEVIFEIDQEEVQSPTTSDKINEILKDIKRMGYTKHVYRVDTNTLRLVKDLIDKKPNTDSKCFKLRPVDWFINNIETPSEFMKWYIPHIVYCDLDIHNEAMRTGKIILDMPGEFEELRWKSLILNSIGTIYKVWGKYDSALVNFFKALKINDQLSNLWSMTTQLYNIGTVYADMGKYDLALKYYWESLKIDEQLDNLTHKTIVLIGIGGIFKTRGEYNAAMRNFLKALELTEQQGDLRVKATLLNNIGGIYRSLGEYNEALENYRMAWKIFKHLGDLSYSAKCLNNIGQIYDARGKYDEALENYRKVLKIDNQLNNLSGKAIRLNNIGMIYHVRGDSISAMKNILKALEIAEQLGNLPNKARFLNNIGQIYDKWGKYDVALENYRKALDIAVQLGDLSQKATYLNNIGGIYSSWGKYDVALENYWKALDIAVQLGDLSQKAINLNNIGNIYYSRGEYDGALEYFKSALIILKQLKEPKNMMICYENIGSLHQKLNELDKALPHFEEYLRILDGLGEKNITKEMRNQKAKVRIDIKKIKNKLKIKKDSSAERKKGYKFKGKFD